MSKKDTPDNKSKQENKTDSPAEVIAELGYSPPPPPKIVSREKIIKNEGTSSVEGEVLKGYMPPSPPPQAKNPAPIIKPKPATPKPPEQSTQSPPEKD